MNWTTLFDFSYPVMSSFNDWLINTANGDMAKANLFANGNTEFTLNNVGLFPF